MYSYLTTPSFPNARTSKHRVCVMYPIRGTLSSAIDDVHVVPALGLKLKYLLYEFDYH